MSKLPVFQINQFKNAERSGKIYASYLKKHLKEHDFITTPHKHNFCLLVFFTKGTGTHEIDFNEYDVKPGSLFVLKPGQVHNWNLSSDVDGYIFFHTQEYYDIIFRDHRLYDYPFFQHSASSPHVSIQGESFGLIEKLFVQIMEEYRSDSILKYRKICSLLDITYVEITRLYLPIDSTDQPKSQYGEKIVQFEELLESKFRTHKAPKDYADQMNISTKHLNRICQNVMSKTTSEMITERVMLEARRMLVHGKYSISQIANEIGFEDPSYFTRLFKKASGETPSQFVNRYYQSEYETR